MDVLTGEGDAEVFAGGAACGGGGSIVTVTAMGASRFDDLSKSRKKG